MSTTISRVCARRDCGGAFLTTLYDPRRFCSERCQNKVKAAAEEARGKRRKQASALPGRGEGEES